MIGATPLYGFSDKQWLWFLQVSRIDPATSWARPKKKKLQSLVQHLKGDLVQFQGMGLPAGQRAWAGGVDAACLDASLQSLSMPGLYFAGEILDLLGLPGGCHYNLSWASAHLAGSAMALEES